MQIHLALHFLQRLGDGLHLRLARRLGGERRALRFDHVARAQELERTRLRLVRSFVPQPLVAGLT